MISPELAAIFFGLAASASWGAGDFSGGLATKRASVISVIAFAHAVGLVILLLLAMIGRESLPPLVDLVWGGAAGLAGAFGLMAFYQALASGRMGVAAPITAVVAALLPVLVGMVNEGLPDQIHLLGFALATMSVFLVSYSSCTTWSSNGLGLAVLGGIGFGLFLVLINQVKADVVFWPLVAARAASTTVMFLLVYRRQLPLPTERKLWLPMMVAGTLDALGNAFFVLAAQAGRLDVAAILSSLYPAMTILLARMILKENLGRVQIVGIVLALVAISLIVI
jgi:drug/metabolite transporter (DMT)-like permease